MLKKKDTITAEELVKHNYIPTEEILTVVQLALMLEKPILIEGPAGTGKTSLATASAKALGLELLRIQCFEGIDSIQVIGEFNYKKQLLFLQQRHLQRQNGIQNDNETDIFSLEFFIPRPLFRAFTSEKRTVLLIDELDAADEEFTAFLLEALGEGQITVPEFGTIRSKCLPVVFMTSNNRQDLPEALRRRALYLYVDYPSVEREKQIVRAHCPDSKDNLLTTMIQFVHELRSLDLKKPPSISETIDWARSLLYLGAEDSLSPEIIRKTLNVVLKHREDFSTVKKELENLLRAQ